MALLTQKKNPTPTGGLEGAMQGQIPLPKGFTDFFLRAGTLNIDYFLERQENGKTKYLVPFPNQPREVSVTRIYDENIRYTFDTEFAYREISRPRQLRVVLTGETGTRKRAGLNHRGDLSFVTGKEHLQAFERFLDEYHLDASNVQSPVTYNLVSLDNDIDYKARPYLVFRGVEENIHGRCVIEDFSYRRSVDSHRIDSFQWSLSLMVYDGVDAGKPINSFGLEKLKGYSNSVDSITGLVDSLGASVAAAASQVANDVIGIGDSVEELLAAVDNIDNQILQAGNSVLSVADAVLDVVERGYNTFVGWSDEIEDFFVGPTGSITSFNRRFFQRGFVQALADAPKKQPRVAYGQWYNDAFGENGTYEGLRTEFEIPAYYAQLFPERYEYTYDDEGNIIGAQRIGEDDEDEATLEQQSMALTASDENPTAWYDLIEILYQLEIYFGYLGTSGERRAIDNDVITGFLLRDAGIRALGTRGALGAITPREYDDVKVHTLNHTMRSGESLMSVASSYLGDPDLWVNLARVNNCHDAHTFNDGRNIGVGSIIRIPVNVPTGIELSLSPDSGYSPEEEMFFTDFEIGADGDLVFDLNAPNDLGLITGTSNVKQAIATRLNTLAGEITRHPLTGIGAQGLVGAVLTVGQATLILTRIREALMADPRIVDVVDSTLRRGTGSSASSIGIEFTVVTLDDRTFRIQTDA